MPVVNLVFAAAGGICLVAGAVLLPTPAPVGVPLLLLGIFLIARGSPRTRTLVRRLRTRFPRFEALLMRPRPRMPRIARYILLATRPRARTRDDSQDQH